MVWIRKKEWIYMLLEAVENDIEWLAVKPERTAPRSGKYQYKWDILQLLQKKLKKKLGVVV